MAENLVAELSGPPLGYYCGKSLNFSCPGDHVSWEILLLEGSRCTIECRSELSPSKGGSSAWQIEGSWEWEEDDAEVIVAVIKDDPLGGPRRDRDLKLDIEGAGEQSSLTFKGTRCPWSRPLPDPFVEELAAMTLKELKAKAEASGLDPSGCVERDEFVSLLQRAKASGALKETLKAPAKAQVQPNESPQPKAETSQPKAEPPQTELPKSEPAKSEAPADKAPKSEAETPASAPEAGYATTDAPTAAEPAAAAAEEASGGYTLQQMTDKRVWEKLDVVSTERETYLPESVFQELFGTSKEAFAKLPKWKRDNAKKKHDLF